MKKQTIAGIKKLCACCGKEFTVRPWRQAIAKYCSWECYNKGRTTNKSYSKRRVCAHCGESFLPTNWGQKYCKRACFTASVKRRGKVECPSCGNEFSQSRVSQKYCSRECGEPYNKKTGKFKKDYIDLLWGDLIKLLAGVKCEYCGKTTYLNSHHIFSRSRMNLRWDTDNGICLCSGHHVLSNFSAHKAPIDFLEWLREKRGDEWYDRLRAKSKEERKYSDDDKLEQIKHLKEKIQILEGK